MDEVERLFYMCVVNNVFLNINKTKEVSLDIRKKREDMQQYPNEPK